MDVYESFFTQVDPSEPSPFRALDHQGSMVPTLTGLPNTQLLLIQAE